MSNGGRAARDAPVFHRTPHPCPSPPPRAPPARPAPAGSLSQDTPRPSALHWLSNASWAALHDFQAAAKALLPEQRLTMSLVSKVGWRASVVVFVPTVPWLPLPPCPCCGGRHSTAPTHAHTHVHMHTHTRTRRARSPSCGAQWRSRPSRGRATSSRSCWGVTWRCQSQRPRARGGRRRRRRHTTRGRTRPRQRCVGEHAGAVGPLGSLGYGHLRDCSSSSS